MGLRVRSGSSAALSQRDSRNARGRWVSYGEGSGEERPRGKRQPTKKDLTAFRGGGRGRGLLGRLCPKGSADPTSPVVVDGWATA